MSRRIALLFLALLIPAALVAQMASKNTVAGTWKLNTAKSKFDPGPSPSSATLNISDDGTIKYQEEFTDGKSRSWSVTPKTDGTPATIEGMGDNATLVAKVIDDRHVEHTWRIGDSTMTGKSVVSKNGKTMNYTLTGTGADGKPTHNLQIYDKQ
jgi:hypothetical protein